MIQQAKKRLCAQISIETFLMEEFRVEESLVSFTILFMEKSGRREQIEIFHCPETEELSIMILGLSEVLKLMVEDEENRMPCDKLDDAKEEYLECHAQMASLVKESYGDLLERAYDSGYEDLPVMAAILFKMIAILVPGMKKKAKETVRIRIYKNCDAIISI